VICWLRLWPPGPEAGATPVTGRPAVAVGSDTRLCAEGDKGTGDEREGRGRGSVGEDAVGSVIEGG